MFKRYLHILRLVAVAAYVTFVIKCDKYFFESILVMNTWFHAARMHKNNPNYYAMLNFTKPTNWKIDDTPLILVWTPWFGEMVLDPYNCSGCVITYDQRAIEIASAVVFNCVETRDDPTWLPWQQRLESQRWVWMCNEPPWNVRYVFQKTLTPLNGVFNWTMTYRSDSDVSASYAIPFPILNKTVNEIIEDKTASALVAWVVSNCHASARSKFIAEFSRYIEVHQFGRCVGKRICKDDCEREKLYKYKFYLALENSLCKEYISEKFWTKAIKYHVVPVVMGPPRREYELVAPPNSFIHVDDFDSAKSLAEYLLELDNDDVKYGEYLKWMSADETDKNSVNENESTEELKTPGICGVCKKLKKEPYSVTKKAEIVTDLDQWWFGEGYSIASDKFSICSPNSGASGFPLRWLIALGYNSVVILLFLFWATSCCRYRFYRTKTPFT